MSGKLALALAGLMAAGAAGPARATPVAVGVVVRTPFLRVRVAETIVVKRGYGRLDIEVEPERAKVYVDGRYVGRGDQKLVRTAGNHRVKVVLGDGRAVETETVHVDAGHVTHVHLDLE